MASRILIGGLMGALSVTTAWGAGAEAEPPCGDSVVVEPGDTLNRIAERCATSMPALISANPQISDPNLISPGQRLKVPAKDEVEASAEAERRDREEYQVQTGDTLYSVAERLGTSVQEVIKANPGLDPNNIPIGRVIRSPGDGAGERRNPGVLK